jgi:hypothetical protein
MITFVKRMTVCVCVFPLTACFGNGGTQLITEQSSETRLVLIQSAAARKELARAPTTDLASEEKAAEKNVIDFCAGATSEIPALLAPGLATVAGYLIKHGIAFVVDKVDDGLKKELETYTATFSGSANGNFYIPSTTSQGANGPALNNSCFRLTRNFVPASENKADTPAPQIAMDFVGAFFAKPGDEAMTIRPLRLYYKQPRARLGDKKELGVVVSLKIDTVLREEGGGKTVAGSDATILKEKVEFKDNNYFYKTYLDQEVAPAPFVPWSTYGTIAYGASPVIVTATVAEAGNAPWWLEKGHKLLNDNKDTIKTKLTEAATALVKGKLPAEEVPK